MKNLFVSLLFIRDVAFDLKHLSVFSIKKSYREIFLFAE